MEIIKFINNILTDALILVLVSTLLTQLREKDSKNYYRLFFLIVLLLL